MGPSAPLLASRLARRPAEGARETRMLLFPHGGMGDSVVFEAIVREALDGPRRVVAVLPPHGEDYDARAYLPGPHEVWTLRSLEEGRSSELMHDVHSEAEALFFRDGPVDTWFFGPPAADPPRVPGCRWVEPYAWLRALAGRGIHPRFALAEEARRAALRTLEGPGPLVAVHCRTSAVDASRNLDSADLAEAVGRLRRATGARVLAVGGELPAELLALADARVAGEADRSLQTTAAHLAACCAFLGGDSGPGHLAAAVGVPVLAIAAEGQRDLGPFAAPGRVARVVGRPDPRTGRVRFDPESVARRAAALGQGRV